MAGRDDKPRKPSTGRDESRRGPASAPVGGDLRRDPSAKGPSLPAPTLPKGGGALSPIGEKLVSHPQTGTAGFSIPVFVSPGRGGVAPKLSLDYDSGAGQGVFGLGWSIGLPAIARKTDKGLPRYDDASESDVFVLGGAEDLVPVGTSGAVTRYRPRVDAAFSRIERHAHADGTSHWVIFSRENARSVFGYSNAARVDDGKGHVFRWLLEWSDDDRGNVVAYFYKPEDASGVAMSPSEIHRDHRNLHPKAIGYANRTMRTDRTTPPSSDVTDYPMVVLFDYGDHDDANPQLADTLSWPCRADSFSSYRAGFELRTHRLCRRVLMLHKLGTPAHDVVRSTDFAYAETPAATTLVGVTQRGWRRSGPGSYETAALPTIALSYTSSDLSPRSIDVDPRTGTVDGRASRWVDYDAEGLPGILREQAGGAWWYQRPRGLNTSTPAPRAAWGTSTVVRDRPSAMLADGWQLQDANGDGQVDLVRTSGPMAGVWTRRDGAWRGYRPYSETANIDWTDPELRFVDLDGDGFPDVLVHAGGVFRWHASLGGEGYGREQRASLPADPDGRTRPIPLFSTPDALVALADMTGDGLADIVHVAPGSVSYWPSLGFGRFGTRVVMERAPTLDARERFDPRRVALADLDGTGTADLVYFGADTVVIARNQAGNGFAAPEATRLLPPPHGESASTVMDVWGRGTSCLVQTSTARRDAATGAAIRVVQLFAEKPYLLRTVENGFGAVTTLEYASSTEFCLADRTAGRPWITKLPFPVHVVKRVTVDDLVAETRLTTVYRYHHGFYDGAEREFRGFALVEQEDTETVAVFAGRSEYPRGLDETLHIPATLTKTWFHTGAFFDRGPISRHLASEYFVASGAAFTVEDTVLPDGLTPEETREACRALRGRPLRVELYALDGNSAPYSVVETNYSVRKDRGASANRRAVFAVFPRETLTVHLEREPDDPRAQHEVVLAVGAYGDVRESVAIAYPRAAVPERRPEQQRLWAIHTRATPAPDFDGLPDDYRVATPFETVTSELVGVPTTGILSFDDVARAAAAPAEPWVPPALRTTSGRWLVGRTQTRYWDDALTSVLAPGAASVRALPAQVLTFTFTRKGLQDTWASRASGVDTLAETKGGYVVDGDDFWASAGTVLYDAARFYVPERMVDPFGGTTRVEHDVFALLPTKSVDAVSNETSYDNDYRLLSPLAVTDPNGVRASVETDVLGMVIGTRIDGPSGEGGALSKLDYAFYVSPSRPSVVHVQTYQEFGQPLAEEAWVYSDGSGREAQHKARVEPGLLDPDDAASGTLDPRFASSGRTVYDNKGRPVKQYEPYFSSASDFDTEPALVMQGVTPVLHYDPVGRLVRVDRPDGCFSEVVFGAWSQETWDEVDTLDASTPWYADRSGGTFRREPVLEARAAAEALLLAGTPTVAHLDALGRTIATVRDAGASASQRFHETSLDLDVIGNVLSVTDPRFVAASRRLTVAWHAFDVAGRCLRIESVDAGWTYTLPDALGAPTFSWRASSGDAGAMRLRHERDAARRPTETWELRDGESVERLRERLVYRDGAGTPDFGAGRVYAELDGAGVQLYAYELRGLPSAVTRHVLVDPSAEPDWSSALGFAAGAALPTAVDVEALVISRAYDAQSRERRREALVGARSGGVVTTAYDRAGRIRSIGGDLPGTGAADFIDGIDYDAKGRKRTVSYAHGGTSAYVYDVASQRLLTITTRKGSAPPLQALVYAYDPVGNVATVRDDAQPTTYFGGTIAPPRRDYTYDALYRLVMAAGREHLSQAAAEQLRRPAPFTSLPITSAADLDKIIPYTEQYEYDASGNLASVIHDNRTRWVRTYDYVAESNRLASTTLAGTPSTYDHDTRGNMTRMAHLWHVAWTHRDQMRGAVRTYRATTTSLDDATSDDAPVYFAYDLRGERVHKRSITGAGVAERIYLSGFELYRERDPAGGISLSRDTLHVGDGTTRLAMAETLTQGSGGPPQLVRFQHPDHLGSAVLELKLDASPLSYEEFHPYGTTALAASLAPKRYAFTGMERDEETGLQCHGVRYYAPWLGRWVSADPIGLEGGLNLYDYVRGNPVGRSDVDGREEVESPHGEAETGHAHSEAEETEHAIHRLHDVLAFLGVGHAALEGREGQHLLAEVAKKYKFFAQASRSAVKWADAAALLDSHAAHAAHAPPTTLGFLGKLLPVAEVGWGLHEAGTGIRKMEEHPLSEEGPSDLTHGVVSVLSGGAAVVGAVSASAVLGVGAAGFHAGRYLDRWLSLSDRAERPYGAARQAAQAARDSMDSLRHSIREHALQKNRILIRRLDAIADAENHEIELEHASFDNTFKRALDNYGMWVRDDDAIYEWVLTHHDERIQQIHDKWAAVREKAMAAAR